MERKLVHTADGSATLHIPEWQEQYHSMHGAIRESQHVFLKNGLSVCPANPLHILEMGFGTGLNALLTCLALAGTDRQVSYTALEAFPLATDEWRALNYPSLLGESEADGVFRRLHECPWTEFRQVRPGFALRKIQVDFLDFVALERYDLIYFDAFGARVQPELWTEAMFANMYKAAAPGGILVTYAAKGSARRAMLAAGFEVERLPGPPGKREMLRARRPGAQEC